MESEESEEVECSPIVIRSSVAPPGFEPDHTDNLHRPSIGNLLPPTSPLQQGYTCHIATRQVTLPLHTVTTA